MTEFITTALTFPTVLWSTLLALCLVYWLLAATGLVDSDGPLSADADGIEVADSVGRTARLDLGGVPIVVAVTLLVFWTWISSYFAQLLLLPRWPESQQGTARLLIALLALGPGYLLATLLTLPLRPLFARLTPPAAPSLIGRLGEITTPAEDGLSGVVAVDDGGAGLLLQVRAQPPDRLRRGSRVVLLAYDPAQNSYLVRAADSQGADVRGVPPA